MWDQRQGCQGLYKLERELGPMATHQCVPAPSWPGSQGHFPAMALNYSSVLAESQKAESFPELTVLLSDLGNLKIHHEHPGLSRGLREGKAKDPLSPSPGCRVLLSGCLFLLGRSH